MADSHHPSHPEVDAESFARAKDTYHAFTHASKWAVIVIAIGVIILAFITL